MRSAAALIIGNEILSGKIAEGNLLGLARGLRQVGVKLDRVVMVLDEIETIAAEVRALSATHDVVVTSGGVGPTHDDVTVDGIARAFGVKVVSSPELEAMLRFYYGDKVTEGHLLMARIPEGARLVSSETVKWPTPVMKNVWMLPGVPEIFAMKIPLIIEELSGGAPFVSASLTTTLDEGTIKHLIDRVVAAHPHVEIGSYPAWNAPDHKTKLTFDGTSRAHVIAARDELAAALPPDSIAKLEES